MTTSYISRLRPTVIKFGGAIREFAANFTDMRFNFLIGRQLQHQAGLETIPLANSFHTNRVPHISDKKPKTDRITPWAARQKCHSLQ